MYTAIIRQGIVGLKKDIPAYAQAGLNLCWLQIYVPHCGKYNVEAHITFKARESGIVRDGQVENYSFFSVCVYDSLDIPRSSQVALWVFSLYPTLQRHFHTPSTALRHSRFGIASPQPSCKQMSFIAVENKIHNIVNFYHFRKSMVHY